MAQHLFSFEEAIDRKYIVTKNLSGQAKIGTLVHVLDCVPKGNGGCTVWYRVTESGQDFNQNFDSLKEFCSWARPDKILIRHYSNLTHKDVMQYLNITNGGFVKYFLPPLVILVALVWVLMLMMIGGVTGAIFASVLSLLVALIIFVFYKKIRKKAFFNIYSKVSKNNWGVIIK